MTYLLAANRILPASVKGKCWGTIQCLQIYSTQVLQPKRNVNVSVTRQITSSQRLWKFLPKKILSSPNRFEKHKETMDLRLYS